MHRLRTAERDSPSTEGEENSIGASLEVSVQDLACQGQVHAFEYDAGESEMEN